MNKLLKGSIAGAVGVALLLGGAGTFASWNSTTSVAGGAITAGNLSVVPDSTTGSWFVNGSTTARTTMVGYKIVPGDKLVYTKDMNIIATGDNLVATLDIAAASFKTGTSPTTADTALSTYLTKSAVLTASGPGVSTGSAPFTITSGSAGVTQSVTVTVTIQFPKNVAAGFAAEDATKNGSVNLDSLAITLTQK